MFTVRRAIIASIVVVVSATLLGIISLSGPPDSGGEATDSYGTRWHGYRATYELLGELGTPVDRRFAPPSPELPLPTTFVFWLPAEEIVGVEPAYLERMKQWVEDGGRIVVAPGPREKSFKALAKKERPTDVLGALGLSNVQISGRSALEAAGDGDGSSSGSGRRRERIRRGAEQAWEDAWYRRQIDFESFAPEATGTLKKSLARVKRLIQTRESTSKLTIHGKDNAPTGELHNGERLIAASFARGKGEIVVVAESSLLMNAKLADADNAVFAYDLLTDDGARGVVFDEFYHGLSVRGNPLWLLTQSRYAVFTLVGLTGMGLLILRRGMLLGAPLEALPKTRRTLSEYVEAMSHLFHRGRGHVPFLLKETRAGALRTLAERYNLAAGEHAPESIATAIARRSPTEAERFRLALRTLDAAQKRGRTCTTTEALQAIQGITRCL